MPVVVLLAVAIVALANKGQLQDILPKATNTPLPYIVSVNRAYVMYSQEGAFLLDVRTEAEFNLYRIPNLSGNSVKNIPLNELPSRLNEIPLNAIIVVLCETGTRSAQGRDILIQNGYLSVTSMNGGMQAWVENNLPVEGTYQN